MLTTLADRIDRLTVTVGRAVAWLALVIVILQFALVLARYVFGVGSIWLTETVIYGHATLIMLTAAWTLRAGGHVRVDVFYEQATPGIRALVDLVGSLLLLLQIGRASCRERGWCRGGGGGGRDEGRA